MDQWIAVSQFIVRNGKVHGRLEFSGRSGKAIGALIALHVRTRRLACKTDSVELERKLPEIRQSGLARAGVLVGGLGLAASPIPGKGNRLGNQLVEEWTED